MKDINNEHMKKMIIDGQIVDLENIPIEDLKKIQKKLKEKEKKLKEEIEKELKKEDNI